MENLADMIARFLWKYSLLQADGEVKVRTERQGALSFSSTAGAYIIRNARSFERPDADNNGNSVNGKYGTESSNKSLTYI